MALVSWKRKKGYSWKQRPKDNQINDTHCQQGCQCGGQTAGYLRFNFWNKAEGETLFKLFSAGSCKGGSWYEMNPSCKESPGASLDLVDERPNRSKEEVKQSWQLNAKWDHRARKWWEGMWGKFWEMVSNAFVNKISTSVYLTSLISAKCKKKTKQIALVQWYDAASRVIVPKEMLIYFFALCSTQRTLSKQGSQTAEF